MAIRCLKIQRQEQSENVKLNETKETVVSSPFPSP